MERDYWQQLLATEDRARGYTDGFKLLFCPWRLIDTADTLFLSLNPGNDPSGEFMRLWYAKVRDVAEQSLGGLAEALRGADFTALKETNDYVREQEREAERRLITAYDLDIA